MNPNTNQLNTEKLIKLVSKYPELYDGKHKDYGDLHKREIIWQRIAADLNVKAELCKAKWNILRGGYRRALRNRESGYSFGGRKWRFEDDLSFLKECVMERRRHTLRGGPENAGSDEDEFITIVKEEPSEIVYETLSDHVADDEWTSSCGSVAAADADMKDHTERKNEKRDDVDSVRNFFLALAETVKTLPPIVQAQVKAEVFTAVNTAELKYLQEKHNYNCGKSKDCKN